MTEQNFSSYEERILAAALRLAQAGDDPNVAGDAVSEIVRCARGMLRRVPPDPADNIEERRRQITLVDVPYESRVEYDDDQRSRR